MGCALPVRASTSCSSGAQQPLISQPRQLLGVRLPFGQCPQNAKPAGAQQIAHDNRQLDPHLFQQTLHLVLQSYPVARELHLHPGHAAPSTLFPVGHKTQDQLVRDQPPHQPLGILKFMLAPPRSTV